MPSVVRNDLLAPQLVDALAALGVHVLEAGQAADAVCVLARGSVDDVRATLAQHPGARALAMTERTDRGAVTALLDAGASGVALVSAPPSATAVALLAVANDLLVVPSASRQAVRRPVFTGRQKQVLSLLVLGLPNAEIAERLFISESTVKMHLSAIFDLLGVRSRKAAVDVILDPSAGLGTGILGIAETTARQEGYGSPTIG